MKVEVDSGSVDKPIRRLVNEWLVSIASITGLVVQYGTSFANRLAAYLYTVNLSQHNLT